LGKQGNGILEFRGNRIKRVLEMRDWGVGGKEIREAVSRGSLGSWFNKDRFLRRNFLREIDSGG
jgi:hypothetical protein